MSWLNNSLNTIKGQLTTLAQEVLAETAGPGDEEYRGASVSTITLGSRTDTDLLAEAQKEKDELDKLCMEKETEILMLRKQIEILQQQQQQQQQQTDSVGAVGSVSANNGRNSKSPTDNNSSSPLEDSWCWEPDNIKNDNDHSSETSSGANSHELVNITLEDVSNENTTNITKCNKSRLQRLDGGGVNVSGNGNGNGNGNSNNISHYQQNVDLQKRLQELEEQNKRLNISLEELDAQHNLAMENMLELKTALQDQLNVINKNYKVMEQKYIDKCLEYDENMLKYQQTIDKLLQDNENITKESKSQLKDLENELVQKQIELNDVQELLKKKSQNNIELVALINERNLYNFNLLAKQKELYHMKHDNDKPQILSAMNYSSNNSLGKQSEDEFIVVNNASATSPIKDVLQDKIVQLKNQIPELIDDNGNEKISLNLENIIKENYKAVEILKEKYKEISSIDAKNVKDDIEIFIDVQKKLTNLEDIIELITINENELKQLREKNELLNRDLEELKDTFNDENNFLTNENESLKSELRSLRQSQTHFNELEQKLQAITVETQQLKLNAEAEAEVSFNHHAELKDKLKMLSDENALLKTEIERISATATFRSSLCSSSNEEKQTVTDLDDEEDKNELEQLFNKIKDFIIMIRQKSDNDINLNNLKDYKEMPSIYQMLKEKFDKWYEMERNVKELSEKLLDYKDKKLVWDHEKKTLEADISHYILQCDELMKNNEILLNELENYKRRKLETISEHNEESIVQLEGQLDELNKLNKILNRKVEELEMDNNKLIEKLHQMQQENEDCLLKQNDNNLRMQTLELEKSKLLLELNNLQSKLDNKIAMSNNVEQLEQLKEQLSDLIKKYDEQNLILEEYKDNERHLKEELVLKNIAVEGLKRDIKDLLASNCKAKEQIESLQNDLKSTTEVLHNRELEKKQINQIQQEKLEIEKKLKNVEEELARYKSKIESIQETQQIAQIEEEKNVLVKEKQEMIKILQQKHVENTQYYTEIQRLQNVINDMQQQQQQHQQQLIDTKLCDKCSNYEIIIENLKKEQDKLNDQINFLKEKSDILTTNLLTEQTNQKFMKDENAEILEQNATLHKDLERLRGHLLEIQDMHTQETIAMQNEIEQMKQRMLILEDEASQSNTAYTSASIRANQHAETLQAQYALVVQQRDDLVVKLSLAEDRESKNQAAIINLQCALEQFQNNKENDIKLVTQRIRRELQQQCDKEIELRNEIQQLQQQLIEANCGLEAAARLSDQLEVSQQTVIVLRDEVDTLKQQMNELELKLRSSECSQADKIEKSLIKSLLIGYVVSGNLNDKQQILRLIATVLEFTTNEIDKIGLNKSSSGWFASLLGGSSTGSTSGNTDIHSKENLVQAFVQFLQQESQPKSNDELLMPNLLNITDAIDSKVKTATHYNTSKPSSSVNVPQQMTTTSVPLLMNSNVIEDFPMSRNSSSILKDILNDT